MEREELLRITARRYAEAQTTLEEAEQAANAAKTRAENVRLERDRLTKELEDFVGRNIPRKLVLIGETKAVLIQMDLRDTVNERVFISLETVL